MIFRARMVVTMDGAPIENGAVATSGNRIIDVGTVDEIKGRNLGKIVDLGEQVLLPGLINAHCHLDYTCLRGKIPPPESFTGWIREINAEKANLSGEDYLASIEEGFAEAKRFGTTSIANLCASPELIGRIEPPIRTWWFAELIDIRNPDRANELVDLALKELKRAPDSGGGIGLAPHAPYTASTILYGLTVEASGRTALQLTTHLAESREEMEMFRDASGPLYDFMKGIGRDMGDCGGRTPLAHFINNFDPKEGWVAVHLNELSESDFAVLARSTKKFSVVHCPRSHAYFKHTPLQFQKLRELGFNICLGTDSLASNDDLSLFAEMRQFQKSEPQAAPEEIISMVTLNAALALGKPDMLARIRAGYWADMIAILFSSSRKNLFEEIVAFDEAVTVSMVNGEIGS